MEIYGAQLTKGSMLLVCDALTNNYVSLIYDTLFNPSSDTLFDFFNGVWTKLQNSDRANAFRISSFEFLKRLASTLKTTALNSRKCTQNC